ncbi:MAG: glyoxalase/bleomycin resistance/dioxygenase family protein [Chlorobi bacterium CHB2]|nr:glyoxalase/bleomycin resistance/dioxygenase family protein [Chlorobi bacterium CHB2]
MSTTAGSRATALKAHIALNVNNVAESISFYKKLFGIEPMKVRSNYAKFDVANPPLNLTLNAATVKERGALSHLGIQVSTTEEVLQMREEWIATGLLTRDEMGTACCYAIQDKTWVRDPDGNEWEVFTVLEDHLPEQDSASTGTCCVPLATAEPGPCCTKEEVPASATCCVV